MTTITIGANTGDTYGTTADAMIKSSNPTTAYGTSTGNMEITKYAAGDHTNTVLSFSGLTNIPAGSTITAATITLYVYGFGGASTQTATLYRLLQTFTETGVTWNTYDGTNNWNTAGALGGGTDRASSSSATASMPGSVGSITFSGSQLVTDIQNYLDASTDQIQFMTERTDGADDSTYRQIYGKEASGHDGNWPYLTITYTTGSSGGSSSLMMMGMGM